MQRGVLGSGVGVACYGAAMPKIARTPAAQHFGIPMLLSRTAKFDEQRYGSLADFAADYGSHTVEHEYARQLFAAGYKQVAVGRVVRDPALPTIATITTIADPSIRPLSSKR